MIRVEGPKGRLYKTTVGFLPSVTTVLKATQPEPFNTERWIKGLERTGLKPVEAVIYLEHLLASGIASKVAQERVSALTNQPMSRQSAELYVKWKTPHSADRGTKLHHFLEHQLPVEVELNWSERPTTAEASTDRLVESLWKAGILQRIHKVVSLEQQLWWSSNGIGYAGSEDISYIDIEGNYYNADWKSKDPKSYSHTKYSHEYKLQLIAYAGARKQRENVLVQGSHINYCLSDGSEGEQQIITRKEAAELWEEWIFRLRAWWSTIGNDLNDERNA